MWSLLWVHFRSPNAQSLSAFYHVCKVQEYIYLCALSSDCSSPWAYWGCQCRINLARPCCLLWMPVSDLQTENSVYSGSACSRKESHEKVKLKASDHNREPWRLKPWWEGRGGRGQVDKAEMCHPLVSGRVSNVFTQERMCRKDMYADLPQSKE